MDYSPLPPIPSGASSLRKPAVYTALVVGIVVAILVLAFAVSEFSNSTGGSSTSSAIPSSTNSTNSIQAENQTYVATYVTSLSEEATTTSAQGTTSSTSSTISTASDTTSYATSSQSMETGGSFTYSPSSQVEILSVAATVSGAQGGYSEFGLSVQFENKGSGTIYVLGGAGSSLNATILSGATTTHLRGVECEMAIALIPIGPGEDHTSTTPGCWSGYYYQVTEPGPVQVELILSWSGSNAGSVDIYAQFYIG